MTNIEDKSLAGGMTEGTVQSSDVMQLAELSITSASPSVANLTSATEELFRNINTTHRSDEETFNLISQHIQCYSMHHVPMVDFDPGCEWYNVSRSLHLHEDLLGHITVLDFFTYCCINCLHVLPQLQALEELYPPSTTPFAVIGVHSAKFSNEKESDKLAAAISRYGIGHPVVNDSQLAMWHKLAIACWPTLVVLGPACKPMFVFVGETHGAELQLAVKHLMNYHSRSGVLLRSSSLPLSPSEHVRNVSSPLLYPGGVTACGEDLLISDTAHHRLVLITTTGRVKTVVGSGRPGFTDGDFSTAEFNTPQGCVTTSDGCIYVADTLNHAIRKVCLASRTVSTVAGTGTQGSDLVGGAVATDQAISSPWAVCLASLPGVPASDPTAAARVLLIAMAGTHQIWALYLQNGTDFAGCPRATGSLVCIAGSGKEENRNTGYPLKASFAQPSGICLTNVMLPFISKPQKRDTRKVDLPPVLIGDQRDQVSHPGALGVVDVPPSAPPPPPFTSLASVPPPPPLPIQKNPVSGASRIPPPPPPVVPVDAPLPIPPPPPRPLPMVPNPIHPRPSLAAALSGSTIPPGAPPPPPIPACTRNYRARTPGTVLREPQAPTLVNTSVALIADAESSSIRLLRLDTGAVCNVVGGSSDPKDLFTYGDTDGAGTQARLQHPLAVAADGHSIYVADTYNHKIKRVRTCPASENMRDGSPRFEVTTLRSAPGEFSEPSGLCVIRGRLFVADTNHHAVKVIDITADVPTISELALDVSTAREDETDAKGDNGSDKYVVLPTTPTIEELTVVMRLVLPHGTTLTHGAPSSWTARPAGAGVRLAPEEGAVEEHGTMTFTITPASVGTTIFFSARVYICLSSGVCTVRAVRTYLKIVTGTAAAAAAAAAVHVQANGNVEVPTEIQV